MLFYFKGGFENAKKKIRGALKVVSDCFLILRGAFKMPVKNQGGTKNAFNFQGGLFHCHELFRGASKLNDFVLQHFSKN